MNTDALKALMTRLDFMIKKERSTMEYWMKEHDRLTEIGTPEATDRAWRVLTPKSHYGKARDRLAQLLTEQEALGEALEALGYDR